MNTRRPKVYSPSPELVEPLTAAWKPYAIALRCAASVHVTAAIAHFRTQDDVAYTHTLSKIRRNMAIASRAWLSAVRKICGSDAHCSGVGAPKCAYMPDAVCFHIQKRAGLFLTGIVVGRIDMDDPAIRDLVHDISRRLQAEHGYARYDERVTRMKAKRGVNAQRVIDCGVEYAARRQVDLANARRIKAESQKRGVHWTEHADFAAHIAERQRTYYLRQRGIVAQRRVGTLDRRIRALTESASLNLARAS